MSRIKDESPNLFDIIQKEEIAENPESCTHPKNRQKKTITIWPGETCQRLTWTCLLCGKIKGRMP